MYEVIKNHYNHEFDLDFVEGDVFYEDAIEPDLAANLIVAGVIVSDLQPLAASEESEDETEDAEAGADETDE